MPDLTYFPLHATAVVAIYNLPTSVRSGAVLAVDGRVICAIMRGNITYWDHPWIKALNPTMNWNGIVNKEITVLGQLSGGSTNYAFTSVCNKIDPMYAAMGILPSTNPNYPTHLYAKYQSFSTLDDVNSAISDIEWSIGISLWNNALTIDAPLANFVTPSGEVISPTVESAQLTLFELATSGYNDGYGFDLTVPTTPRAWPALTMNYLYINKASTRTTCATKKMMVRQRGEVHMMTSFLSSQFSIPSLCSNIRL